MKHTDVATQLDRLQEQEQREFLAALKAHGGSFTWYQLNDGADKVDMKVVADCKYRDLELPIVTLLPNCWDVYEDIAVCNAVINCKGVAILTGFCVDDNLGDVVCGKFDTLPFGHLSRLTDTIPETPEVSDVSRSENEFAVLTVSRADLESRGYDTSNVSDDVMKSIAQQLKETYGWIRFENTIDYIADYFEITKHT